jgi:hypothetical protein
MAKPIVTRSPVFFSALADIGATLSKARADLDALRNSPAAERAIAVEVASGAALDLAMRLAVEALDAACELMPDRRHVQHWESSAEAVH